MDRSNFFFNGIKAGRHKETKWLLTVFTLGEYPYSDEIRDWQPYDVATNRDSNTRVFYNPETQSFEAIMGIKPLEPIILYKEPYIIKAGDLVNIHQDTKSTGGTILCNLICLIIPFGDKAPYLNKKLKPDDINDVVEGLIAEKKISADEFYYWCECVNMFNGLWGISTPTGSAKTMAIDKKVTERRDELLKQHANELDNTVVIAEIEKELVGMDKASFKGDVAEDFFISNKSFETSRKKAHIMYGLDDGLGGSRPAIITKPLSDGMDVEYIPANADTTRAASYSRGFLTAQGGELVNYLYRIFMNSKIAEDDCGTKTGVSILLTEDNMKRYYGRYAIDPNAGKTIDITPEFTKTWLNKTINVRTPARCKTKPPNFCGHCTDTFFFKSRETVHIETSLPGSIIMNDTMKAMHGRSFKIAMFDPQIHYT